MVLSLETLNYLQEEQRKLDIFIHQQNGLEMKDTFYLRKLALLVEIGEVANELKSFKYWKKDKEINLEKVQEELIDCLHFFLSLANCSQIDFTNCRFRKFSEQEKKFDLDRMNRLLINIFCKTKFTLPLTDQHHLYYKENLNKKNDSIILEYLKRRSLYRSWLGYFEEICWRVGLNEKKLLETYDRKNKINQERQLNNY